MQVVSEAFRLTELYADFDQSRRALVLACLDSYSPVYIETLLAQFKIAASDYRAYFEDYIENADYSPERRRIALNQSNPERLARVREFDARNLPLTVDFAAAQERLFRK